MYRYFWAKFSQQAWKIPWTLYKLTIVLLDNGKKKAGKRPCVERLIKMSSFNCVQCALFPHEIWADPQWGGHAHGQLRQQDPAQPTGGQQQVIFWHNFYADFAPINEFVMAGWKIMMIYHALLVQKRFPHHFLPLKSLVVIILLAFSKNEMNIKLMLHVAK